VLTLENASKSELWPSSDLFSFSSGSANNIYLAECLSPQIFPRKLGHLTNLKWKIRTCSRVARWLYKHSETSRYLQLRKFRPFRQCNFSGLWLLPARGTCGVAQCATPSSNRLWWTWSWLGVTLDGCCSRNQRCCGLGLRGSW